MTKIDLLHGDCLELMKDIPDKSVDMILADLPYGTTACKWDSIIPFEPLWKQYERVIKDNGVIALFGSQPFSSLLVASNIKNYRYDWLWDKVVGSNFINAKKMPLKVFENISVFYKKQPTYNPQMEERDKNKERPKTSQIIAVHNANIIIWTFELYETSDYGSWYDYNDLYAHLCQ